MRGWEISCFCSANTNTTLREFCRAGCGLACRSRGDVLGIRTVRGHQSFLTSPWSTCTQRERLKCCCARLWWAQLWGLNGRIYGLLLPPYTSPTPHTVSSPGRLGLKPLELRFDLSVVKDRVEEILKRDMLWSLVNALIWDWQADFFPWTNQGRSVLIGQKWAGRVLNESKWAVGMQSNRRDTSHSQSISLTNSWQMARAFVTNDTQMIP